MRKLPKIILSFACAVFVIAVIGFGIWRMTCASPAAAGSQNSSVDKMQSGTRSRQDSSMDSRTPSIKITTPDGSELTIVNPPVQDSYPDIENIEWGITNYDHTENEDAYTGMPVD